MKILSFILALLFLSYPSAANKPALNGNEMHDSDLRSESELLDLYAKDPHRFIALASDEERVRLNQLLAMQQQRALNNMNEALRTQEACEPYNKDLQERNEENRAARRIWLRNLAVGLSIAFFMPCHCLWWTFGPEENTN